MLRRLFYCFVPSLALALTVSAQVSGPTPLVPTGAVGQPTRPGATNRPVDMVTMQYPNSDVLDVLHLYENLTGKKLVIDNNVQGKVNIFIAKPIPREEAINIIEMNLALNGFSLVPTGGDVIEVVGVNKNPRAAAVPIVSDPADLPAGAMVVSYLFHLNYADPQELQQVLSQYLAGIGGQAPILALPKSSSLLITQSADVLRKLVKMVEQIDVAPAEVTSLFIKLERADAQKVVDMLKEIFDKGDQTSQPGGVRRIRGVIPPGQPQGNDDEGGVLSEDSLIVGKIRLEADVRTNRIHVVTRPINLPFIEKLISEFDANVDFGTPVTRPLKYIAAADVLPVLVQALTEPGDQNQQGGNGSNQQGRNQNRQNQQQPTNQNQSTTSTSGDTGGEGTLQVTEGLSTEPVDTAPQAVIVGNTKLIADARANTIIVLGNREVVLKVEKILDEMDVRAPQVALSTVIGELTLNNDEEFGVDYFLKYKNRTVAISRNTNVPIPGFASPSGSVAPINPGILDPAGLINFSQILQTAAGGTNVYIAAGNYLSAIVHALDSTSRFKVISRPTVFTSNNKKAIIASGTEIPVPSNTISSPTTGGIITGGIAQSTTIEFKKVALQLEVVPLINSEKEVSLDILQKVDSLAGTTRVDNNLIPNIATRYIRTTVSAPNGATIVLGGLIMDSNQDDRTGIPILGRLPLVGPLFRNTSKTKMRTELIILMRPEVSLTKLDLYRLRQKNQDRTHFGPELNQDDCPDCPPQFDGKQLPPPDLPMTK